ncbi:MAG: hypothetical protein ACQCN6_03325 [Candidatus Bathyarchaeia archaeon]|jgi:hypothetical protein
MLSHSHGGGFCKKPFERVVENALPTPKQTLEINEDTKSNSLQLHSCGML